MKGWKLLPAAARRQRTKRAAAPAKEETSSQGPSSRRFSQGPTGTPHRRADSLQGQGGGRGEGKAGKHGPEDRHGLGKAGRPEDHEAHAHRQQGVDMSREAAQGLLRFHGQGAFQGGEKPVPRAPEDEGPAGPVPQAAEQEDHGLIEALPGRAPPPASQGDVQVIPEPEGEGQVPPPPELGDGGGNVGVIEVLRGLKAEQRPQADGHVAVAGEVKVNLQGVGNRPQPGHPPVQAVPQGESGVDHRGGHFGNQGLLGKAHGEAPEPLGRLPGGDPGAFQPLGELAEAGDGAGDRLGEEGEIEQHVGEAPGPGVFVPVDVDGGGHGFKGEKRNAQGSQEPRSGELRPQQAV